MIDRSQCLYAHVFGGYARCLQSIENAFKNATISPLLRN